MASADLLESMISLTAQTGGPLAGLQVVQLAGGPFRGWNPLQSSDEPTRKLMPESRFEEMVDTLETSLDNQPTLALAPFTRFKSSDEYRSSASPLRENSSIIEHALARIDVSSPVAHLLTVTPASVIENEGSRQFREIMCEDWHPTILILANPEIEGIHPSFRLAISAWTRSEQAGRRGTRFFEIPPKETNPRAILDDFARLLRQKGGTTLFGYVKREPVHSGDSLGFRANSPEAKARKEELLNFGPTSALTDIFAFFGGRHPTGSAFEVGVNAPREGMLRVIGGRDVLQDGSIADPDNETKWVDSSNDAPRLQSGDLIFREILSPKHRTLVFARYSAADGPATPGSMTVTLRARREAPAEAVAISLAYLGSQQCKMLHDASASSLGGHHRINLRSIRVPQPDTALATAVKEIQEATHRFDSWSTLARDVLSSAFSEQSMKDAYAHIVGSGRTLRLRAEAATAISDFSTIVRTRFPHPLSYRWRTVEANLSVDISSEAYVEILEAAEVLLCFLAQIALAGARDSGKTIGAVTSVSEKLSSKRSGPGFGDWLTILTEVKNSRAFRAEIPEQHVLRHLQRLLADEAVDRAVRSIKARRDALAHLRRPSSHDLERATGQAFDDLRRLFESSAFLAETPLLAIDSTSWDSLDHVSTARARSLVGDHPVVQTHQLTTDSLLDSDSLYLSTQTGLILLRPFLVGRACPDCGHWSTFHADGFDGEKVQFKSLERGHVTSENSEVRALRSSGLLA